MSFDLTPGDDLRQITDAAQAMLETHFPVSRLRGGGEDDLTPLAEFGTWLLAIPEEEGGAGFSVVEEARLHALFGQHLISPGAIAGAVAMRIAMATDQGDLAQAIGESDAKVAAGVARPADILIFDPNSPKYGLIRTAQGLNLASLGDTRTDPQTSMGHGRPVASAALDLTGSNSTRAGRAAEQVHTLLTSAHLLGVATAARDLAVDYAKTREQFGQPIGSFQAIKHHCANMAIGVEMLSAQLDMAALALRNGADDADFQLAALACIAPQIALKNARLGIQIHGGIGFSAEADAQLCLKQAHILRQFLGTPDLMAQAAPMAPLGKTPT